MKSKLALGLLTAAATLIASGTALAQQSNSPETAQGEYARSSRGDNLYAGDSSRKPDDKVPAPEVVPAVATRKTQDAGKMSAGDPKRTDSTAPDQGRYDYYKDLAPFGE
jgi:hypothetical protein